MPRDKNVAALWQTVPLMFVGEISVRYIRWMPCPRPAADHVGPIRQAPKKTAVTSSPTPHNLTSREAIQDPRRYNHFIGSDRFACQHDRPRCNTDAAAADCSHFPENRATAACLDHNTQSSECLRLFWGLFFLHTFPACMTQN